MQIEQLQKLAQDVAAILGATYEHNSEDTWRASIVTAEGINLIFSTWNKKTGEVWAYQTRGNPRGSEKCGEIGVTFSRGPAAVAKEIEKRLLPDARVKATAARERWAGLDNDAAGLRMLADELACLPGVRAELNNPGDVAQRVRFKFYDSEHGSLSGEVTASGYVSLDRAALYGPDPKGKLIRVLTALRS